MEAQVDYYNLDEFITLENCVLNESMQKLKTGEVNTSEE